ncbi:hypothetical protein COCMIDRAFT_25287 [Bipolaris oryzae ATCC 44560]|uniref:Uncharacterized protein n=1 Tax=Bipolaris oryzae ATCC 44560 TaxID=930090 RepID=W6Z9L4_COCMI|nr:uncharacterized protein COCMIDRAFT_25287 [Bipolaris oryzae ATCC 44560]EUC46685.1 hypothetical protein COCMIDRAFT_25287 [Bipolaris oryzae ATCC 44560]
MIRARWCHGYQEGPKGADDKHAEATGHGAGVQHTHMVNARRHGESGGGPFAGVEHGTGFRAAVLPLQWACKANARQGGRSIEGPPPVQTDKQAGGLAVVCSVCVGVGVEAHGWRRGAGSRAQ